ncbi:hypothetical protein [Caminibacter mediatlanticus]|uniref:Phosphoribosylglycinamide formyltransferase 2 n=1 Tax=Caminibacter mediatlanticus TB-2 TaxID=391592 RepID=A0AAI9AH24_9BACT|nr:hypothetical protein [Caminibacter mediatlanticus]EDM23503.1 phosphoribosylglycinamide formyltransferase 2 [Caminibacter mediatlanticus TB-2]
MKFKNLAILSLISTFAFATNNQTLHQQYLKAKQQADAVKIKWEDFNNNLYKEFNALKKQLPLKQGENLVLNDVNYNKSSREIVFKYKLYSKIPDNKTIDKYKKTLKKYATSRLCTTPMIIKFFENKGKVIYSYDIEDKNKKINITLKTEAKDCKHEGIW